MRCVQVIGWCRSPTLPVLRCLVSALHTHTYTHACICKLIEPCAQRLVKKYLCADTHAHKLIHTHTRTYTLTHVRTQAQTKKTRACTHTQAYVHPHKQTCANSHTRTYTHAHVHTLSHTHVHTHMCIHTYTHSHLHTHTLTLTHTHTHLHTLTHTHTHTLARLRRNRYGSVPGLKVVAPWSAEDCKGLLKVSE